MDNEGNLVIVVPRLHGKTTAIKMFILRAICYKITDKIVYLANEGLGEKLVSDIMYELQNNERIIEHFGNILPQIKSRETRLLRQRARYFDTATGISLEAITKGQRTRGKRAGLLFVDDPEEDSDVNTRKKIEQFRKRFFSTLYNILYPKAKVIVLGTVISKDCLVMHLIRDRKRRNIFYKAIENGKPLREAMRPIPMLKKRLADVGRAVFRQEFMHVPIDKNVQAIKEEWIRYRTAGTRPSKFRKIIMGVDPAEKVKERNDYTGIAVRAVTEDGKSFSLYTKKVKLTPANLTEFCKKVYRKFEPDLIHIETNKGYRLYEALQQANLPVAEVVQNKDKYTRLLAVSPHYENGNVYHRKEGDEDLEEQITSYPDTDHDDVMDARVLTFQETDKSNFLFYVMS